MAVADRFSPKLFNLFTIKNIPIKLCLTSKSVPGLIPAPAPSPYLLSLPEAVSSEVANSTVFRSVVQPGVASATALVIEFLLHTRICARLAFAAPKASLLYLPTSGDGQVRKSGSNLETLARLPYAMPDARYYP